MSDTKLLLIDGHALIYRAYHAFPGLTDPTGRLVNAVYGFSRLLLTSLKDLQPTHVAVAFDHKGKTKRAESFEQYKAHRPPMPDDLKVQIQLVKDVVTALNIPAFSLEGYEADDIIGTIVEQLVPSSDSQRDDSLHITILTGDKDLLQLVRSGVTVYIPSRSKTQGDREFDAQLVKEVLGITPEQVVDLKALMGDASDNIPGIKGIGKKTGTTLIQTYGSLDGVYKEIDRLENSGEQSAVIKGSVQTKLTEGREIAYQSQELARILTTVQIDFNLDDCAVAAYDKAEVTALFESFNFKSLLGLLPKDEFEMSVQEALF
ncbi:MAG: hypothetical protein H6774_00135 [Pseudomonadales bacterium]|nr:hypothetical protein [Candidatus Woesebacteria bacterium]MCB9801483.1 hypothetical protein [Pseudomonadales bacterium]